MMKPMLFSVGYAGLWGQHALDVLAFIRKASSLGYEAVELMCKRPHLSVLDADDRELDAIGRCADEAELEIGTLAAYTDFTAGATAKEVPFVEMQLAYVRTLADFAKTLGASVIRVFTGYATAPEAFHGDWTKCVKALRECAALAADRGVAIGVQNHHDTGVAWESFAELLADVDHPNCKAAFDPWAVALHGDDLYKCASAMAQPLGDAVRAVPLGEGFIDFDAFFAGLKEGGFSGYVAYEMCSPLRGGGGEENLDRTAKISAEKIRELIS